MKHFFLNIFNEYPVIKYIIVSLLTASLEATIGFFLVDEKGFRVIEANTFSIFFGTTLHYLLISKSVFHKKYSLWTILVYGGTFIMGIVLQNIAIYYSYEHLLASLSPYIRYTGSKLLSITIPFGVVYSIRKKLYLLKD